MVLVEKVFWGVRFFELFVDQLGLNLESDQKGKGVCSSIVVKQEFFLESRLNISTCKKL